MAAVSHMTLVNWLDDTMEYETRVRQAYRDKLKNRLYGLLCEREKEGEWEKFLDGLLIELYQFDEESKTINYYRLIEKLSKMKYLRFSYFRPLVFECMNLIDKIGD